MNERSQKTTFRPNLPSALEAQRRKVRSCTLCFPDGGNSPVADEAKPKARAMLVGQAPGVTEVTTRRPFTGRAGKRLDGWLKRAGVSREEVHFSAVARCFPGKAKGGGDKVPPLAMISNCRTHLTRDFELVAPKVVILVGGLAIKEVLGLKTLSEAVGKVFRREGVAYLPLPHPSGASTWLNLPENERKLEEALTVLKDLMEEVRSLPGSAREVS